MSPRRVIEDSDDDGDDASAFNSPGHVRLEAAGTTEDVIGSSIFASLQAGNGETNPILFQKSREEPFVRGNRQAVFEDENPILDGPIVDLTMSSSPPNAVRKRLKRSKTMNSSPVASHAKLSLSNQEDKGQQFIRRTTSSAEASTPKKPTEALENDPWEFSGSYDELASKSAKAKSGTSTFKTYGKSLRRKTMSAGRETSPDINKTSATPSNFVLSSSAEHGSNRRTAKRRRIIEDIDGQVERSMFEDGSSGTRIPLKGDTSVALEDSNGSMHTESDLSPNREIVINMSTTTAPLSDLDTSMVIIPNTLTSSQKLKYETVHMGSSDPAYALSLPDMMESIVCNNKFTEDSSTVPNDTPTMVKTPVQTTGTNQQTISPSNSSSLVDMASKRSIKRSQSMAFPLSASHAASKSSQETGPIKRRKTAIEGGSGASREPSVDELSLEGPQISEVRQPTSISQRPKKRRAKKSTEEEVIQIEDLFGSDDIGLPREMYKPRPSRRRSKSITAEVEDEKSQIQPLENKKQKSIRRSKSMGTKACEELDPDLSVERTTKSGPKRSKTLATSSCAGISESLKSIDKPLFEAFGEKSQDTDANEEENTATVTEQPKKRGRPKKIDVQATDDDLNIGNGSNGSLHIAESKLEKTKDEHKSVAEPEDEDDAVSLVQTAPKELLPKRRGRPKKATETMEETQSITAQIAEAEKNSQAPTETKAELSEASATKSMKTKTKPPNMDQEKPEPGTPSGSRTDDVITLKDINQTTGVKVTPTKDMKKGPDQHSPLQSGKVPYRIGLSKRMRIAPLLKIAPRK